jgi:lysophospholipase L1-like esterase
MAEGIQIWGDSLLMGVVYDEARSTYTLYRENCINALKGIAPFPVKNHSQMGGTAAQALRKIKNEPPTSGGMALIEFGGNDCNMDWAAVAANPVATHKPKTPPAQFAAELEELITCVRAIGMQPMLVVPTPLHAAQYFEWVTKGLDSAAVLSFLGDMHRVYRWQELYAVTVLRIAAKQNCPVVDLRSPFLERDHYEELLCIDGMHPNAAGHALMFETLKAALC